MRKNSPKEEVGSSSSVKPYNFFKIITFSNVKHGKLQIPRKFVDKYGNSFRKFVLLKVPSGAVWLVELNNSNGDVWLCNGWKKFADYYSIRSGHLLLFEYKGDSNFNVIIFDKSASEIDYPVNAEHVGKENVIINSKASVKEEIEEDGSVQIVENFPVNDGFNPTREIKKEHGKGTSAMARGKIEALKRAKSFKPEKPIFMVNISPSHVSAKATLTIPTAFAHRHLQQHISKGRTNVTLQASFGRTWSVTCRFENGTRGRVYWPSFARDNGLKIGHVCVFEMIDHADLRMNVHIFRAK